MAAITGSLPATTTRILDDFVAAAREAWSGQLRAVVLYGSAVEGRLRPSSDVNLVLVLASFDPARADRLRPSLRLAEAAIRLRVMFLVESEITDASRAFAQKFADIARRRQRVHSSCSSAAAASRSGTWPRRHARAPPLTAPSAIWSGPVRLSARCLRSRTSRR